MYPSPEKSYKNHYPFKLGTTSFIYPDTYAPNVKMLGPYLDEIELLFMESNTSSLPSKHQIDELALLAKEFDLTYNIHLPSDIFLGNPDPSVRLYAVETVKRVVELAYTLTPSTWTLHLVHDEKGYEDSQLKKWLERIHKSLKQIVSGGINSRDISIETLSYPFEWLKEIIDELDLSVCVDLGHLFLYGFDPKAIFNTYSRRISILHLHGVENKTDHIGLERLNMKHTETVVEILKTFTGVVSLEVFSYKHLASSLVYLEKIRD